MINQESRRLDAEKIRQEFIKSTKFKLTPRYPSLRPRVAPPSSNTNRPSPSL
jgi:hypothetical protein